MVYESYAGAMPFYAGAMPFYRDFPATTRMFFFGYIVAEMTPL